MRKSSLAAGAAVFAAAVLGGAPAMASSPVDDASGTPMCGTSQLSAALGGGDAGAGNLYRYLVITNTGSTTCHLTGYPGLSMLDANGRQIGQPATRDARTYAAVVLRPGAAASDTIHTVNHQGTCLPASTKLKVYPPGNTASLTIPGAITDCYNTFAITPLAAGKGGNDGGTPTTPPSTAPTAAPSAGTGGAQVPTVPSGAPDTGLAAVSHSSDSTALAATGAGVAAVGVAGIAVALRRKVRDGR
ncbi:hypothetical protein RVR_97 [Actinacidiphila reveromycinica]|uniref:DUF4232 domain-containing protein n=1 Tax=Actinacidiphila reveromycinica TaxID=659352 RepID=A0A7U3VL94_9ACTN|nr:DUF4232 domain-containing protein [Streptomyces sp. SN-593]BBA95293.1 hypothetical protein RVR_97 [Streptomyces sp. SN-593]